MEDNAFALSLLLAAAGGALSFLSPCVLPLLPAYLSWVGGKDGLDTPRARLLGRTIAFVTGFSCVFVLLGLVAAAAGGVGLAYKPWMEKIAGGAIVLMGLHIAGWLPLAFLSREWRPLLVSGGDAAAPALSSMSASWGAGVAFGFGWTPCIGPILGAILTLAAHKGGLAEGALLLSVYSLGLGAPFILAALAWQRFLLVSRAFRAHQRLIETLSGLMLIATGLLVATGALGRIAFGLMDFFPFLGRLG